MGCETFLFVCVCCSVFNRACDHAPQGSVYDRGGALQEQALFEVPKDNQAGNPHILSPGLVYRPLEKHGKKQLHRHLRFKLYNPDKEKLQTNA